MTEQTVTPKFRRGQKVRYRDHTDRRQTGTVQNIEVKYPGWGQAGDEPNIYYTVSHPTYRNNQMHTSEENLRRVP